MNYLSRLMIAIAAILMLGSCDNNPYYENAEPSTIEGMGKTYLYIEQYPVQGLEYECGYLEPARTDANGGFLYDLGSSCRFYLNNREIFVLGSSNLHDGKIYDITDQNLIDQLYVADVKSDPYKIVIVD